MKTKMYVLVLLLLGFSAILAQEIKNKNKDVDESVRIKEPNGVESFRDEILFKNETGNAILTIIDEGDNAASISLPPLSAIGSSSGKLYNLDGSLYWNETALLTTGFSIIGGSGTINYIPKFSSSTTLQNSTLYETSNKIGIGTTTPQVKLSLGTDITAKKLAIWDGVNDFYGFGVAIGRITFYTNDTEKMTIKDNGNVGINITNPQAKLDVNGSVKIGVNGIKFSELYEITGTTGTNRTSISYPTGYDKSNARIISYEVVDFTGPNWVSGYGGYLWVALRDSDIYLGHEASFFNGQPFRLILMKVE